jgi:hypothetical protein
MIDSSALTSSALKNEVANDDEPTFRCLYCSQKKVRLQGR